MIESTRRGKLRLADVVMALVMPTLAMGAQEATTSAPGLAVLDSRESSRLIVTQVRPEYPALAKVNYIQGSVRMQLLVTREGRVGEAHVIRGHPFLAAEALQAVRRWAYRMPLRGRGKAGFLTFVEVNFALRVRRMEHLPPRPEKDLDRQVLPPAVTEKPESPAAVRCVALRVLVGADGSVIDSGPLAGPSNDIGAARTSLKGWKFQPARWGNHAVPWYIDVEVPAAVLHGGRSGASPIGL
jgi:TonB family protein